MLLIYYIIFFQLLSWVIFGITKFLNQIALVKALNYKLEHYGTYIHEISHWISLKITFAKVSNTKLTVQGLSGSVEYQPKEDFGFVRTAIISLSPLLYGSIINIYIFRFLYYHQEIEYLSKIGCYLIILAIVLAMSPSYQDYKNIWNSILNRPLVFIKQTIFILIEVIILFSNWSFFSSLFRDEDPLIEFGIYLGIFLIFESFAIGCEKILALMNRDYKPRAKRENVVYKCDPIMGIVSTPIEIRQIRKNMISSDQIDTAPLKYKEFMKENVQTFFNFEKKYNKKIKKR
jgi:hypothetical protein